MGTYSEIIKKKKKDWNCSGLMDSAVAERGAKLPFSSPLLNYCTYGGIPRNQITEFFGDPGGGKSSTAIDICKNAYEIFQKEYAEKVANTSDKIKLEELEDLGPKRILYVDLEHSFDGAWAKSLGIEPGTIDIMQPPDVFAEDILQTVQELIDTGQLGLVA